MTREQVKSFLPEMERLNVSIVARSQDGFTHTFLSGKPLTKELALRRHNFITRTLPAYNANPTYRRMLSLYAWAYSPRRKVPAI